MVSRWDANLQRTLNTFEVPAKFTRAHPPIPIQVRIVWQHDGQEWIDAEATAWTRTLVLARFSDRRLDTNGAWVVPGDVNRR